MSVLRLHSCLLFALLGTTSCQAQSKMPPFESLNWVDRTYETEVPEPFGPAKFHMKLTPTGKIQGLEITVRDTVVEVDPSLFEDVRYPREPYLEIDAPYMNKNAPPDRFMISFDYGRPVKVELEPFPGCPAPCYDWAKDFYVITVYSNLEVKISHREVGQNETAAEHEKKSGSE